MASVRGRVLTTSPAPDEVYVDIFSESCGGPELRNTLVKVYMPDQDFLKNPPAGFKFDRRSILQASAVMKKALSKSGTPPHLIATVDGVAYASASSRPDPTQHGIQKTEHGRADAYLIIKSVHDVVVQAN